MEAITSGPTSQERATCWSITINNPTPQDLNFQFPPGCGWHIQGQVELGKEGTTHYQGMLKTPQVRFKAVKRCLPRAHIEAARNPTALQAYVHKEDTRVAEVAAYKSLTVFGLMDMVIAKWDDEEFTRYCELNKRELPVDLYARYSDVIIRELIENGAEGGIEYVAINPMWRSAWLRFGEAMVKRSKKKSNILI